MSEHEASLNVYAKSSLIQVSIYRAAHNPELKEYKKASITFATTANAMSFHDFTKDNLLQISELLKNFAESKLS